MAPDVRWQFCQDLLNVPYVRGKSTATLVPGSFRGPSFSAGRMPECTARLRPQEAGDRIQEFLHAARRNGFTERRCGQENLCAVRRICWIVTLKGSAGNGSNLPKWHNVPSSAYNLPL